MARRIKVTVPAEEAPLLLPTIKEHLQLTPDETEFDNYLVDCAIRASAWAEGYLNRSLLSRTYQLQIDAFPGVIELPLPPTTSLEKIDYVDEDGAAQTLDLQLVSFNNFDPAQPATVRPAFDQTWPTTRAFEAVVTVEFISGYDDPELIPEDIQQAILLSIGDLFEHREASTHAEAAKKGSANDYAAPLAVRNLLRPHRIVPT